MRLGFLDAEYSYGPREEEGVGAQMENDRVVLEARRLPRLERSDDLNRHFGGFS